MKVQGQGLRFLLPKGRKKTDDKPVMFSAYLTIVSLLRALTIQASLIVLGLSSVLRFLRDLKNIFYAYCLPRSLSVATLLFCHAEIAEIRRNYRPNIQSRLEHRHKMVCVHQSQLRYTFHKIPFQVHLCSQAIILLLCYAYRLHLLNSLYYHLFFSIKWYFFMEQTCEKRFFFVYLPPFTYQ